MKFSDFVNIVADAEKKTPILFGLSSDCVSTKEMTEEIEAYYSIQLPKSYKDFLENYGGGYFAYTVVYSWDAKSEFYLADNVSPEWVREYHFFPVIEFETGDLGGFRVVDKKCDTYFSIFNHEEKQIRGNEEYDFLEALLKYGLKMHNS